MRQFRPSVSGRRACRRPTVGPRNWTRCTPRWSWTALPAARMGACLFAPAHAGVPCRRAGRNRGRPGRWAARGCRPQAKSRPIGAHGRSFPPIRRRVEYRGASVARKASNPANDSAVESQTSSGASSWLTGRHRIGPGCHSGPARTPWSPARPGPGDAEASVAWPRGVEQARLSVVELTLCQEACRVWAAPLFAVVGALPCGGDRCPGRGFAAFRAWWHPIRRRWFEREVESGASGVTGVPGNLRAS